MTTPIKSNYDTDPWEPTIDTSSDEADQVNAAQQYTQIYGGEATTTSQSPPSVGQVAGAAVPTLAAAYTQAPDFVPTPPPAGGGGSASGGTRPEIDWANPFYIELSALRSTEQKFLDATSTVVDGYETLKTTVTSAINAPNTFGQKEGYLIPNTLFTGSYTPPRPGPAGQSDVKQLDKEGSEFASATDPQMQQLLNAVGGVIEAWGVFNALLNNTGQMYAYTDQQSSFAATR